MTDDCIVLLVQSFRAGARAFAALEREEATGEVKKKR
jgi:hypothetical protein